MAAMTRSKAATAEITWHPAAPVRSPHQGLCLLIALLLLAVSIAQRLWFLIDNCPFDLSGDEAHYWEWSRHLDWSYYSKGPLVAWLIALGRWLLADWSVKCVGNESLAVRIPAVLLSSLTGLGIYILALRTLRSPWKALGSLALTATIPITAAGAVLMTIDAPLATAWVWTLVCIHSGLSRDRLWPWLVAGILIALGTLAKFNMVFIYAVMALLLTLEPTLRQFWTRPGPWLAALLGLLGWVPIIIWNAQHGWVSVRHVAGQAGVAGRTSFDLLGPLDYAISQFTVLGPVWFICGILAVRYSWRPHPADAAPTVLDDDGPTRASLRLLTIATVVPFLVFLVFSPITKIQPNWPAVGIVAGCPLLVHWLATGWTTPTLRKRRGRILLAGISMGLAAAVLVNHTEWLMPVFKWLTRDARPWELTPVARYDPTARLRGWKTLGAAVDEVLQAERDAGHDPFILTDDYQVASEIAFYTPGHPPVTCAQSLLGGRRSQYDIWVNPIREPAQYLNRPVLFIGARDARLTGEAGTPPVLENLRLVKTVEALVAGAPEQVWAIFAADRFLGFPNQLHAEKY